MEGRRERDSSVQVGVGNMSSVAVLGVVDELCDRRKRREGGALA